jgi:predicted polyphosphate/ATP-dependent NAD kinase
LGAVSPAQHRAGEALAALAGLRHQIEIVTYPGEMGADVAKACGFTPLVVGTIRSCATTAQDTSTAAQTLRDLGAAFVMFAGGDGTARNMVEAVGTTVPAIGIPAGVKIQSAVYAVNPTSAGHVAASYLRGEIRTLHEAEVLDLDEEAYRQGVVSPRLYGYLRVPLERRLLQPRKSPSLPTERASLDAIATEVIEGMQDDDAPHPWLPWIAKDPDRCGCTPASLPDRCGCKRGRIAAPAATTRRQDCRHTHWWTGIHFR